MLKRLLFLILALPLWLGAAEFPAQPQNYVTDRSALLTLQEQQNLNAKLKAYQDRTSNQFFVYITDSLSGRDMSQLCQEIFHAWKIGSSKNNGVLIAVFVKEHKFRIHTGYGLEGALPDLATKRIQSDVMAPEFKQGHYFLGLDKGINALSSRIGKEFRASPKKSNTGIWLLYAFIANVLLFLLVFYLIKQHSPHPRNYRKKLMIAAIIFALLPFLGALALVIIAIMTQRFNTSSGGWSSGSDYYYSGNSSYDNDSGSNNDSDSGFDFGGGDGGDSGGGGSDGDW